MSSMVRRSVASYTNDTLTALFTNSLGSTCMAITVEATNTTTAAVNVEIQLVDSSDVLLHQILPSTALTAKSTVSLIGKYVVNSTDKVLVKASAQGVTFYATVAVDV